MTRTDEPFWAPARPSEVNVTMPAIGMAVLNLMLATGRPRSVRRQRHRINRSGRRHLTLSPIARAVTYGTP
jgi:hypothetical protein